MPTPKVIVLRAPGTNCDVETAFAFEQCGAKAERVHLFRVLERPELLRAFQVLCVPGGFSYGDDVGAGVIFGSQIRSRLSGALREFLQADKLALGICNGFQVLMKSGVLPGGIEDWDIEHGDIEHGDIEHGDIEHGDIEHGGIEHGGIERGPLAERKKPETTLTWNDNGRYTARWARLTTMGSSSVFLKGIGDIELPVAHAEGKIVVRDDAVLSNWRERRQIALCYRPEDNPNGSTADIAGLSDPTGRVLGLMPHPERHIHATQHPQWTRRESESEFGEGLALFRNAVQYFA